MDKLKSLWNDHRALFLVIVAILLLVLILLILDQAWLLLYLAIAAVVLIVVWLAFDSFLRGRKRRKQEELDTKIAAKEGVDDRRREWTRWTKELRQQGIDRYDLPFYLLVGEPQSGKSVMLHNSGLHFPFGQSRLSGPGGTRGCDWWFTEEAVILDLAGRLFTHEGGASDAAEWEAFLELLASYRPLSPANGVLLVIPCDSLLEDSPETVARKAGQIQDSLLKLVGKLQAQLPIYLVLTKADRVFGFAETVHKMDTDRRRQMFGWSRPAEDFEKPFDLAEFRQAFAGLQHRAHLLRAQAMSTALIPDALPEIDRLFAFPEEMKALEAPLEACVQRIFTESSLVDRLFFRGVYLTSGLQKGAPIAKACAALLGGSSEADSRDLEGLFGKQRAFFIYDLIQRRVFTERGLVRPTSQRVLRARRIALAGYGAAAGIALLGTVWTAITAFSQKPDAMEVYGKAIERTKEYIEQEPASNDLPALVETLLEIRKAEQAKLPSQLEAGVNNRPDFRELYVKLFEKEFAEKVRAAAEEAILAKAIAMEEGCTYQDLVDLDFALGILTSEIDLATEGQEEAIVLILSDYEATQGLVLASKTEGEDDSTGQIQRCLDIQTSSDFDGAIVKSPVGPSAELKSAASEYCNLLDKFAKGEIPRTKPDSETGTGPTELEHLVHLWAARDRVREAADALLAVAKSWDPDAVTEANGSDLFRRFNDQDTILTTQYGELREELRTVDNEIDEAAARKEYTDLSTSRQQVIKGAKVEPQAREWATLFRRLDDRFFTTPDADHRIAWWQETGEATVRRSSGVHLPPPPMLGSSLGARILRGLAVNQMRNLGESFSEQGPEANPGRVSIAELAEIDKWLEGELKSSLVKLRTLSGEKLMKSTNPAPVTHRALIPEIWATVADHPEAEAAGGFLKWMVALEPRYVNLYEQHADLASLESSVFEDRGSETVATPSILGLRPRTVNHLVGFYQEVLANVDPTGSRFHDWRAAIEHLLSQHVAKVSKEIDSADDKDFASGIDSQFANVLCDLTQSFAKANPDLSSEATKLLGKYLDRVQKALLSSWKSSGATLELTTPALRTYLAVYSSLEPSSILEGHREQRNEWLAQVDEVLDRQLEDFETRLDEFWTTKAETTLSGRDLRKIARIISEQFDSDPNDLMHEVEDPGAPAFSKVTAAFNEINTQLSSDVNHPLKRSASAIQAARVRLDSTVAKEGLKKLLEAQDFQPLADAADEIKGRGIDAEDSALADGLREVEKALPLVEGDEFEVGVGTYCRIILKRFRDELRKVYGTRYKEAFTALVKQNRGLLTCELFCSGSDDWGDVDSIQVNRLQTLLGPEKGKLSALRERFSLESLASRAPKPGETDAAGRARGDFYPLAAGSAEREVEDFLLALQEFFYPGGAGGRLEECTLAFEVSPVPGLGVWNDGDHYQWWWPSLDREDGNPQIPIRPSMEKYIFSKWILGRRQRLQMGWTLESQPPNRGDGLVLEIDSPLAPLILAWHFHGVRDELDPASWAVTVDFKGREEAARIKLRFIDRELPVIPDSLQQLL